MKDDLISRRAVIEGINNLIQSPFANSPQFGKERREVMETVKAMCVSNIPTAYDSEGVIKKFQTYKSQQEENEMLSDNGKWLVQRVIEECEKILNSIANATNENKGDERIS